MPVYIGKSGDLVRCDRCLTDRQQKIELLSFSTVSSLSWVTQFPISTTRFVTMSQQWTRFVLLWKLQFAILIFFTPLKNLRIRSYKSDKPWKTTNQNIWGQRMEQKTTSLIAPSWRWSCQSLGPKHQCYRPMKIIRDNWGGNFFLSSEQKNQWKLLSSQRKSR